jgi:hypothetical protein
MCLLCSWWNREGSTKANRPKSVDREGLDYYRYNIVHCSSPLWASRRWDASHWVPDNCQHRFAIIDPSSCSCSRLSTLWKPLLLPIKPWRVKRGSIFPLLVPDWLYKLQKLCCSLHPVHFSDSVRRWGATEDVVISISWSRSNGNTLLISTSSCSEQFGRLKEMAPLKAEGRCTRRHWNHFPIRERSECVIFSLIKQTFQHIYRPSNSW